jgi:ABC-type nitrate/sulfonate/bicarbonate transport system ATPase subunit
VPHLEIIDVSKSYVRRHGEPVKALSGVSLSLEKGEFVSIVGPSGCGKTTLFDIIAGLTQPDSGAVFVDGHDRTGQTGYVSYMPQEDLLLPWRTTLENAMLAPELSRVAMHEARSEATRSEVRQLIDLFGLSGFEDSYPFELSGGMRQRVAFLRTVMCKKDIMLLDEPFGALDAMTRHQMQTWLRSVWERLRATVLFVTHDVEEAIYLSDRVYVMSPRPGKIVGQYGVPFGSDRSGLDRPGSIISMPEFVSLRAQVMEALASMQPEVGRSEPR